jgi:hypothetical protein
MSCRHRPIMSFANMLSGWNSAICGQHSVYAVVVADGLRELVADVVSERESEEDGAVAGVEHVCLLEVADRSLVVAEFPETVADVAEDGLLHPALALRTHVVGAEEVLASFEEHAALVEGHSDLVVDHGVGLAQIHGGLEVELGSGEGVGAEVLHADVEVGEVAAGEEPSARAVDRHRLCERGVRDRSHPGWRRSGRWRSRRR